MSPRDPIAALLAATVLAAAPAAAEIRAPLRVGAEVVASCRTATARPGAACSHRIPFLATTAARADERPLDEAAALLGAPVRRARRVRFTAPLREPAPAPGETAAPSPAILFHTITY